MEEPENQSTPVKAARRPLYVQVMEALLFMQQAAKEESKRNVDKATAVLLPLSCFVLIGLAYFMKAAPQIRHVVFLAPLAMFGYFLAVRIGIVKSMTPRQAYLTCHMLIACFLLGVTVSVMIFVYVLSM
jgi:hypothetical protein